MAIRDFFRAMFAPIQPPASETEARALSFETIFGHDLSRDDVIGTVSASDALGDPFVYACQSLISGTIASLPMDVVRKVGDVRLPQPAPAWIDEPDPFNPNFTDITYKRQIAMSLLQDGNAFIAAYPSVLDPQQLVVLDPSSVEIKRTGQFVEYSVTDRRGIGLSRLSALNCVHIPFIVRGGEDRGLSPIEASALSVGIDLAALKQKRKFLAGGGLVTGVIEVPRETGTLTEAQVDGMRESFKRKREGPNGYSIGVLEGGAKFHELSMTSAEAEYIAGRKMSREEIAGIYLIPPFFIGSEEPAAAAYASTEARAQHLIDYCLVHYGGPIERGHRRLVPGADTYVYLNYNALLRGNLKERYESYALGLQNKFLYQEDVWRWEDLDPNRTGTLLETPNNNGTPQAAPAPRGIESGAITVTSPPVNVTVESPAPPSVAPAPFSDEQRAMTILRLLEDEEPDEVSYDLTYDETTGRVRTITERAS